jgi:membrane protease YdiL (CAAX protease family)
MTPELVKPPGFWTTVRLLLAVARKRAVGRRRRQQQLLNQGGGSWNTVVYLLFILMAIGLHVLAAFDVDIAVTTAERIEKAAHGSMAPPLLVNLPRFTAAPAMLGSLVLLWWSVMLVFYSEGLDLDVQRRRHPMWEWLFADPAPIGAVFMAELLSPIAANPFFIGAPLFPGLLYGKIYGVPFGFLAAFAVGIPICVAAACAGKALEISVMLWFSPRSRGAVLGLMSWLGFASMMILFLTSTQMKEIAIGSTRLLAPLARIPWPWLGVFLGERPDASFSFVTGVGACWLVSAAVIASAVGLSVFAAGQGLSGAAGRSDLAPKASRLRFGRNAVYRKELLWFLRDRGAVVQAVLVPISMVAFQAFNMRAIVAEAQTAWHILCGVAILFGTYFIGVLGPKSLASEGAALWIALTWPRGLESLLKAKAWLWSLVASAIVLPILVYGMWLYPANSWKIALVGVGWFLFARSLAEKMVTLATVMSPSGEMQKVPKGRVGAAWLGTLTFSVGVMTQQWAVAITGIVYSFVTSAAMWQNFRARLPFLYDPWSEELPRPPTLMHAMIAISLLIEVVAVIAAAVLVTTGPDKIAIAQAVSYGASAMIVSLAVAIFLTRRGVLQRDIWRWRQSDRTSEAIGQWHRFILGQCGLLVTVLIGAVLGLALGLLGQGYLAVLHQFPEAAKLLNDSQSRLAAIPNLRLSYFIMAVAAAPFAEEYLFRGLLYRALDREWGGWRAIFGSAAFFAVYHPPLSWLPVGLVGIVNAVLFKKTGRLAPAVVLHVIYNAVVLS